MRLLSRKVNQKSSLQQNASRICIYDPLIMAPKKMVGFPYFLESTWLFLSYCTFSRARSDKDVPLQPNLVWSFSILTNLNRPSSKAFSQTCGWWIFSNASFPQTKLYFYNRCKGELNSRPSQLGPKIPRTRTRIISTPLIFHWLGVNSTLTASSSSRGWNVIYCRYCHNIPHVIPMYAALQNPTFPERHYGLYWLNKSK